MPITLDAIITDANTAPPRIIFYSPEGVGKTTWAADAPNPIFIPTEKGQGKLKYARFPQVQSFQDVVDAIALLLKEKHDYKTVVLDTMSRLEQIIHSEIRADKGDDIFGNYGRGHKLVPPYFERLINGLNRLQDAGMMVVVLGHSEIVRFEPPGQTPYDLHQINVHKSIRDMMFQWCDICLFANYQVFVTEKDGGFGQKKGVASGGTKRVIFTQERPTHKAKNRYDLPYEIPLDRPFAWKRFLELVEQPDLAELVTSNAVKAQ